MLTPVITPVDILITATPVLLLLHEPPEYAEATLILDEDPSHNVPDPNMVADVFCTYSGVVLLQPAPKLYVIVVIPTAKDVATPVADTTDAMDGVLLAHVPPGTASTSVLVTPRHIL